MHRHTRTKPCFCSKTIPRPCTRKKHRTRISVRTVRPNVCWDCVYTIIYLDNDDGEQLYVLTRVCTPTRIIATVGYISYTYPQIPTCPIYCTVNAVLFRKTTIRTRDIHKNLHQVYPPGFTNHMWPLVTMFPSNTYSTVRSTMRKLRAQKRDTIFSCEAQKQQSRQQSSTARTAQI